MSRTYRKRRETFEQECGIFLIEGTKDYAHYLWIETWGEKEAKVQKALFYSDKFNYYAAGMPKSWRRLFNKMRRARDSREVHKTMFIEDYIGDFDPWNGATNHHYDYW